MRPFENPSVFPSRANGFRPTHFQRALCFGLLLAASARLHVSEVQAADQSPPLFALPAIVESGKEASVKVTPDRTGVTSWQVNWGDGKPTSHAAGTDIHHRYLTPGVYQVDVFEEGNDGTRHRANADYAAAVAVDRPAAYVRFGDSHPGESRASGAAGGDIGIPAGLPWGGLAASFGGPPATLPGSQGIEPADRFSVEFWLRTTDLVGRQTILASATPEGSCLYLGDKALCLELPKGAVYSQPLPASTGDGAWHHLAVSYDRTPLFPYQNTARFYVDGVLAGEERLDRYDTGRVAFANGALGNAPGGRGPLKGSLAELAIYTHLLPPHRILNHALLGAATAENRAITQTVVVPPSVEDFTVDAPRIVRSVPVPLDPAPGADNGPALRVAISEAEPGTSLQIVNRATSQPGGEFYVNSLDRGNDWAAIRVLGKHDLEIDGNGATLVFGTNCRQIYIKGCQRVALRNFAVDLDQTKFRVGVYARIASLDTLTGDIRFQFVHGRDLTPERTVPASISMWRWRPHDPKTLRIGPGPSFKTGESFIERPSRDPADPSLLVGKLKPSMIKPLEAYRQGANFFMVNNARFENSSVGLENSEQMTFERLRFYSTLGMVFLSSELNHVRVSNCKIGLPPGLTAADRPLASGADGYHFHDTQGYVLFENNEVALTDDDPITIKDGVRRDVAAIGADGLTLGKNAKAGDEYELYRWDFSPLNYRARIVAAEDGKATMDRPLPADLPKSFTAMNTRHHTNQWIIRGCDLHDYYGRLLLCTAQGLVAENVIQGSYLHVGASNASFDSSGIASAVTVRDNLLLDTHADIGIWGTDSSYPVFKQMAYAANSFVGQGLYVANAGEPLICGNYFEMHPAEGKPSAKKTTAVKCTRSVQPVITGNTELGDTARNFGLDATLVNGAVDTSNNRVLVSTAKFVP